MIENKVKQIDDE